MKARESVPPVPGSLIAESALEESAFGTSAFGTSAFGTSAFGTSAFGTSELSVTIDSGAPARLSTSGEDSIGTAQPMGKTSKATCRAIVRSSAIVLLLCIHPPYGLGLTLGGAQEICHHSRWPLPPII